MPEAGLRRGLADAHDHVARQQAGAEIEEGDFRRGDRGDPAMVPRLTLSVSILAWLDWGAGC
jgi:hypothetical protein